VKSLDKIRSILRGEMDSLRKKYHVRNLSVFGSFVREEQGEKSDIDLLVEFDEDADLTFLDFVQLRDYLGDLLGAKVDLVDKKTLKPAIGKEIKKEAMRI
jgi:hypothetical protein